MPTLFALVSSGQWLDRKSTRLNSSHTVIYTLSLHDALPICQAKLIFSAGSRPRACDCAMIGNADTVCTCKFGAMVRSEEHTSELQSHSDLHSFPTRRSSDLSS